MSTKNGTAARLTLTLSQASRIFRKCDSQLERLLQVNKVGRRKVVTSDEVAQFARSELNSLNYDTQEGAKDARNFTLIAAAYLGLPLSGDDECSASGLLERACERFFRKYANVPLAFVGPRKHFGVSDYPYWTSYAKIGQWLRSPDAERFLDYAAEEMATRQDQPGAVALAEAIQRERDRRRSASA